jgi:hypothetical protein
MTALARQFGVSDEVIEIAKAELLPAAVASAKKYTTDRLRELRDHFLRVLEDGRDDPLGLELARMLSSTYAAIIQDRVQRGS